MTYTWIALLETREDLAISFRKFLDDEKTELCEQAAAHAASWDEVLLARGGLQMLEKLRNLLHKGERENVARARYDRSAGRRTD